MVVADELLIKVKADTAQAERQMSSFAGSIKQSLNNVGSSLTSMGKTLTTRVTLPIVGAGVALVNLASDAEESTSKFNTVFGEAADEIRATIGNIPQTMGMATAAGLDFLGTMGAVAQGLELTDDEVTALVTNLGPLAADMASFHNIPVEQAANAFISALAGEREALKSLGIVINEEMVKQKALEMGIWDGKDAIDARAKALATEQLIFEKAGVAVGDFERTSDGLANQMRIVKGQLADAGAALGQVLLPYVSEAVGKFSEWVDKFMELNPGMQELIVKIGGLAAAAGPALIILGQAVKVIGLLTGPLGLVIAAIAAAVFILNKLGVDFDDIVSWFQNVLMPVVDKVFTTVEAIITEVIGNIAAWITDHMDEIQAVFQTAIDFVIAVWENLVAVVGPLVEDIINFINEEVGELVAWFEDIWPVLSETVMDVLGLIQRTWERVWPIIAKYIMPIWEAIKSIISGALDVIKGVIKFVLNLIQGNWGDAWDGILQALSGVWNIIKGVVTGAMNIIKGVIELGAASIRTAWDTLWTFFGKAVKSAWDGITGFIGGAVNGFLGKLESFINTVIAGINELIEKVNKIPGVNFSKIGNVKLPRVSLAEGGMPVGGSGRAVRALVGERGPEEVLLPAGSTVVPGGGGGPLIGQLITQSKDARGIAEEVGWELMKRGAGS